MTQHPFHKSSFRPHLIMGAERKPMLMLLLVVVSLAVTSANLVAYVTAGVLWMALQPLLIWMAMVDPQMSEVYFRNRIYPGYIPAFTTPFRKGEGYRIPSENRAWKVWRR